VGEYEQVRRETNGRELENFVYFFFSKVSLRLIGFFQIGAFSVWFDRILFFLFFFVLFPLTYFFSLFKYYGAIGQDTTTIRGHDFFSLLLLVRWNEDRVPYG
jgi:hypothetical protein